MLADQSTNRPTTVLVVDDYEDAVLALTMVLRHQGYLVVAARDGEEAVQVTTEMLPDLVLMDLMMPRLDGWGATTVLKEQPQTAHIPVVACTAKELDAVERARLELLFDAYLSKPVRIPQLLEMVQNLCRPPLDSP